MSAAFIWIALFTTANGSYGKHMDMSQQFKSENDCRAFVATAERLARDKNGMANVYGVCIQRPAP